MWYSQYSTELEKLCEEYERNNRFAATGTTLSLSLHFIINAIKIGVKILLKKHPQYQGPIEAMIHYLDGSGKPVRIDEKYFDQEFKDSLLFKVLQDNNNFIKPKQIINSVILYDKYDDMSLESDDDDTFTGRKIKPLRYIIGGFTANIWYDVDENNIIHIYLKIEDIYDFKSLVNDEEELDIGGYITLNLEQLGLDSPQFINILDFYIKYLNKAGLKGIEKIGNDLNIKDYFWASLEKLGIAKPYKHYYEGEIYTIYPNELANYKTPEEKFNALHQIANLNINNISDLQYAISHGINGFYGPTVFDDILMNDYPFFNSAEFDNLMQILNIDKLSFANFSVLVSNSVFLNKILEDDNIEILSYLDQRLPNVISRIIMYKKEFLHGKCLEYIKNKYKSKPEIWENSILDKINDNEKQIESNN